MALLNGCNMRDLFKYLNRNLFLKHPKLIELGFKWWPIWSNFYQKIERKFMDTSIGKLTTYNQYKINCVSSNPEVVWETYCDNMGLKHYGSDKWYMGFDVVSCPERVLYRRCLDCDDFGFLGYKFFDKYVNYDGKVYKFDGIHSMIWDDGAGHAIAVYIFQMVKHIF
jgi:hypothetical protein